MRSVPHIAEIINQFPLLPRDLIALLNRRLNSVGQKPSDQFGSGFGGNGGFLAVGKVALGFAESRFGKANSYKE